jgi:uncharacterized membrane protein
MLFLGVLTGFFLPLSVPPLRRLAGAAAWRDRARCAAALGFVMAGLLHFAAPESYLRLMPPDIPAPLAMVYVSGVFEILGGLGLLVPRTRRAAAWGLTALLLAVFPANLHVALAGISVEGMPTWYGWARLPFQAVYIAWVLWSTPAVAERRGEGRSDPAPAGSSSGTTRASVVLSVTAARSDTTGYPAPRRPPVPPPSPARPSPSPAASRTG